MTSDLQPPRIYRQGEEIFLSDPDVRYRITIGAVLVNIAAVSKGRPGRRLPGKVLDAGSSLFSLGSEVFTLTAIARTDVEIEEIPLLPLPEDPDAILLSFAAWIHSPLFEGLVEGSQEVIRIPPGSCNVDSGERVRILTDERTVVFCTVRDGVAADTESDMTFSEESGWFPVTGSTILDIRKPAALVILPPGSVPPEIRPAGIPSAWREWIIRRCGARWEDRTRREQERMQAWLSEEARICECIVHRGGPATGPEDPVVAVFNRVLAAVGKDLPAIAAEAGPAGTPVSSGLFTRIARLSEEAGVRVRLVRLPAAWWEGDHGPLLVPDRNGCLYAAIPERPGRYRLYDGYGKIWQHGQISELLLFPAGCTIYPSFPDTQVTAREIASFVFSNIWRRDLCSLITYAFIAGLLTTAIPLATGLIFSYAVPHGDTGLLMIIILVLCASVAASAIFSFAMELSLIRIQGSAGKVLEPAVWDRVLKLPPSFFRNHNAGELASRIGVIDEILKTISGVIVIAVFGVTYAVFYLILLFLIFPEIAWIVLLFALLVLSITLLMGWLSFTRRARLLDLEGHLTGTSFQMLTGIVKIRAAGAENRAYLRWERELHRQVPVKVQIGNYEMAGRVFTAVWPPVLTLLVFSLSIGLLDNRASLSDGWFLAFITAVGAFAASFAGLGDAFIAFYTVLPRWDWMRPVLTAMPEVRRGSIPPGMLTGALELSHVSFSYSEEDPLVLEDVSLSIAPGEFVAIVGASGCGKSTLLRILLGFEEPDTGTVLYDGQNLSELNIRDVRKQIGVVLQDGQLMADTIMNNIAGSRHLTEEEVWNAARMAGIADDIDAMPLGMRTVISEGASNISGGQKQRILIARAIASQPRIIFFDEATSSLDNISQKTVSRSLEQLRLTRVIIAHRISTIENADRIYVLEKGKIVEAGKFEDLLEKGGVFSRIARRQMA